MRKIAYVLSAAVAALSLASCDKETTMATPKAGDPVEVTVTINGGVSTRVTGVTPQEGRNDSADEARVNTLQILVFNGGERETYRKVDGSLSCTLEATAGERVVWAVVNAPDLSSCETLEALERGVTGLSDNSVGSFVMAGSRTQELVDGGTVPVTVKRVVARVSVGKISTSFRYERENYSLDIQSIYLINVGGVNFYNVGGEPASYVNRLGHNDAAYDALLFDALDGVSVSNGKPYETAYFFYPYPNTHPEEGEAQTFADEWDPRGTLLVIQARALDADGSLVKAGYYPVVLPALERNKTYHIDEVNITRLPGDVPYRPIQTGDTQVTVTVNEWETGLVIPAVTI